ncbi:aminodeoxychorismate/anthranilate synthase component II [Oenococcus sp. UCMA 16435]|nr:aminodeoxychorismate/anthranilate synthase component II [Oenococcus sp. UCMA 16435]MDI4585011.1 aminodeoxychorismate/anthranilate synthase component II [Oenococcus sp. UCMA 14587]
MFLLIDNYDSFTYNLYQLIGQLTKEKIVVVKNDQLTIAEIGALKPQGIIISPGPGRPEAAGITLVVVRSFLGKIPLFGVCLGHQAICFAYGAQINQAKKLMHGKTSQIKLQADSQLFFRCPATFKAARYHSLVASKTNFPSTLQVTATSTDGEIMAVADEKRHVYGVQFHPESIMTDAVVGKQIIKNFLTICSL